MQYEDGVESECLALNVNEISNDFGITLSGLEEAEAIKDAPINPQTLSRYSYVLNNPYKYVDPSGHDTLAFAINVLGGALLGAEAGAMIVVDDQGNWGYIVYYGGGGFAGLNLSGGVSYQWTNADTIFNLEGMQIQTGAAGGEGVYAGCEYVCGGIEAPYWGLNINAGVTAGYPVETHRFATWVEVDPQGNSMWATFMYHYLTPFFIDFLSGLSDMAEETASTDKN